MRGDILTVANRDFVNKFLREIVNPAEKGKYVDKNGAISQEGVTRIKNAIFAKAYGNTLAIEKLAESTDNNVKKYYKCFIGSSTKNGSNEIRY